MEANHVKEKKKNKGEKDMNEKNSLEDKLCGKKPYLTVYDLKPEEIKQAERSLRKLGGAVIPEQLKGQIFIRIKLFEKLPNDLWRTPSSMYAYNDKILKAWLEGQRGNYGVPTGFNELVVLDLDEPKRASELGILEKLPKTFIVKTRSGGLHYYYRCPIKSKLILYDKELKDEKGGPLHIGELQAEGQYVVGPGSLFHLCNEKRQPLYIRDEQGLIKPVIQKWEVLDPSEIAEIPEDKLLEILSCLAFKKGKDEEPKPGQKKSRSLPKGAWQIYTPKSRDYIKIEDIAMPENVQVDDREGSGKIQGTHPFHGSENGHNLDINVKKNAWYCHRCKSGGGPVEWLAIEAGLRDCRDFEKDQETGKYLQPNPLAGIYKELQAYAAEKGLKLPPRFNPDVIETGPKGGVKIRYRALAALLAEELSLKRVISQDVKADLKFAAYDAESGIYRLGGEAQALINKRAIELLGDGYSTTVKQNLRTYLSNAAERIEEDDFEPKAHLINCKNGVVDLRAGQLLPWSPDYLQIFQAAAAYNPSLKAPKWESFLEQILPDEDLRRYAGLVSGYYITGETSEQIFHIPYGSGQNGKSKWIEVQTKLLGSYARQIPISTFIRGRGVRNDQLWSLAELRGRRWVYAAEPNLGDSLDQSLIKSATGGEKISARFMREGLFEFEPRFKFTLETNNLPELPEGLTFAMKRRVRILPFIVQIQKVNKKIAEELLLEEGDAIFTWLCRQAKAYYASEKGLQEAPEAVLAAGEEYAEENDPLAGFVSSWLEQGSAEDLVLSEELQEAYENHCMAAGAQAVKGPWFVRLLKGQLKSLGWMIPGDKGRTSKGYGCIRGIRFIRSDSSAAESSAEAEDDKSSGISSFCDMPEGIREIAL